MTVALHKKWKFEMAKRKIRKLTAYSIYTYSIHRWIMLSMAMVVGMTLIMIAGSSPGYTALASQGDISQSLTSQNAAPVWSLAMKDTISGLSQRLKEQQSEKNRLLKESDKLAAKILKEKQKSGMSGNRKLDSMLRDSQQLVSDLESISRQIKETGSQLRQNYSSAITSLVRRLEEQSREEPLKEKEQKNLLKHLIKYLQESEMLEEPMELTVPKVSMEIQDNDTPFEIKEKADFLSDQAILLKARIFQLEAQVTKLEREKALRNKVSKFADEMNFFDDSFLVKERKTSRGESGTQGDDPGGDPSGDSGQEPILGDTLREIPASSIARRDAFDSSPSDLIVSKKSIDEKIELLKEQKSQLANQIQYLLQKTQTFYKRANELSQSENH